jgi:hypothetical protein
MAVPEVVSVVESYEIEFRGEPGPALRAAFSEFDLRATQGSTRFRGEFVDQAALHGIIERINSFGLELVALRRVDNDQAIEHEEWGTPNWRK